MLLRQQMESGALSADKIDEVMDAVMADLREKKPPKAAEQAALEKEIAGTEKDVAKELAELKKESLAKSKEVSKLGSARGEEYNLGTFLKNKLTRDDVIDINPEKSFAKKYLAPKNVIALELADMVADGKLDAWLPPNMRTESETFDEKDATEYIKEQLRQGEFRVYDAQNQQRLLGEEVSRIDERIKQLEAARKATKELPQMTAEERQQEAAALAAQAGFQGAPMEVAAVPEEQEEYFPDQEEARGKLAEEAAPKRFYPGMVDLGYNRIDNVSSPRIYKDAGGEPFLTFEKDGLRVAMSSNNILYEDERGKVNTGYGEPNESIIRALIVDPDARGQGKATAALQEIIDLADQAGTTLYVEPAPIEGGKMSAKQLADLYKKFGFTPADEKSDKVLVRKPVKEKPAKKAEFVINKDKEHERIEKELTGKTMLQVAQWAVDNAPNQFAKVFAQKVLNRLNGMAARGIKLEFQIHGGQNRPNDMYRVRGITEFDFGKAGEKKLASITVRLNGAAALDNQNGYPPGTRYITVLHELLHASTVGQTRILGSSDPIVKELRDLFNQVVQHFNTEARAGRLTPFMEKIFAREINALESPDELLAWGIADEDMQRFLSDIKVGDKTIMDKLVELIRKILNVTKPYLTALDQLVRTTESILDEDVNVVGDKIISRQYSFGVKPGGQPVQGTLFEKAGPGFVSKAAKKVAEKIEGVGKKPGLTPDQGFGHVDPNYLEKLKPFFAPEGKTFADKMDTYKDRTFQRLAQGIADQYRTIKDYSPLAYIKARMSKTVDGALEGLTFYGQVKLTDGALDIKPDTKGLIKTLEPIGNEVNSFLIWLALNRDAALVERGRIASISPEIVEERNKMAAGKIGDKSRLEVYEDIRKELNKLNKSVLDVALQQGLIDKKSYDTFLKDVYYIPFYKMVEEGEVADIRTASGLANKYFSKALKGGEKPFGDLMENLLRNWNHILSSSMKNDAAVETIKAATEAGAAYPNLKVQFEWKDGQVYSRKSGKPIPAGEVDNIKYAEGELRPGLYSSDGKGLVKVMMNGYPAYYEVIDPLLVESIMSIGYMGPKSKFLDMARDFKNILQYGVTLSPAFKVRNLVRDSVQSAAVSNIGLNIGKNVTEGLAASKKGNPDYISALAGGAIFNFGSYMEGDQARQVKRLIKQGVNPDNILNTEAKIKNGLKKMYDAYQELGNRSEAANRMALYKQLRAKGFSHLEASFQARDLLDFSMQGAWPAVRLVTQVIPFLNARIQGLYKLGRDGIIPTSRVLYNSVTGKPLDLTDKQKAQQFSIVSGAVVLASLMLYMAFKDDDEFKKREQWDRDNFWWFRLPGMEAAIRIPKPFEIGAMGTFAERIAEQMFDEGAEGRVFEQSMKRMLTDTFAINPIPQMIKPLVDLYANKDSFTGAPIETAGMERLSKAERVAINTSPLAKALSQAANVFLPEATEVSPVQTDYAIKAYLGWMGATISATSHYAVMPFSKSAYPDHNWTDTMSLGFVRTLPANQSGYVTSFYENMKTIEQAYADMRHYAELGQADKVQQILEEKGDKIQLAKFYDKTSKDMAKIRQAIQVIQRDETMDGAQKREEIDRLKQLIGDLAKQAEDVRKSLRQ
jgi:GNAT superfamily N-acetyltransferase